MRSEATNAIIQRVPAVVAAAGTNVSAMRSSRQCVTPPCAAARAAVRGKGVAAAAARSKAAAAQQWRVRAAR